MKRRPLRQVLHVQDFLHRAPGARICVKALQRRAAARRVRAARPGDSAACVYC
jgi:hypothetical protein